MFDPDNSGFAFPEFGEGYANFGFLGVALCGVLLGGVAELLHHRLVTSHDFKGTVVAAVQAGVFLQLFSRGDFAPMFTTYIGILVAAQLTGRRRSAVLARAAVPRQRVTYRGEGGQLDFDGAAADGVDASPVER
jgi:hypothetical protein